MECNADFTLGNGYYHHYPGSKIRDVVDCGFGDIIYDPTAIEYGLFSKWFMSGSTSRTKIKIFKIN